MKHDDKVGEDICEEESQMYQREVIEQVRVPACEHDAVSGSEKE
jgi:hypothetical protein